MPEEITRPPEILPGVDELLKNPFKLHNVTITKGHSLDPSALEINATCTDPKTLDEIPVGIVWKRNGYDPDSQHLRAGGKTSKISGGRTDWDHLEAESQARRAVVLREALEELLEAYRVAKKCQAAYLDEFEQFVVDRFDEIAQQPVSPRKKKPAQQRYPHFYILSTRLDVFGKNIKSELLMGTRFHRAGADHRVNVTARCFTWGGPEHGWELEATWELPAQPGGRPWRRVRVGGKTIDYSKARVVRPADSEDLAMQTAAREIASIQDWADDALKVCMDEARGHALYVLNKTAARRTRGLPPEPREEWYFHGGHPVPPAPGDSTQGTSDRTEMDITDPSEHPVPIPGEPHLYDVIVTSSGTRRPHIDMQAKFPDVSFPEGATVRFFWDRYAKGEPELMVQAATRSTRWNDGKFSRRETDLDDGSTRSRVRLEVIQALYSLYEPIAKAHDDAIRAAHDQAVIDLNTEIQKRTRHLPYMDSGRGAWLASQPDWFPEG